MALVSRLVRLLSNKNHLVLDPFVGVGSTIIGALMHGRRSIGAEIDAEYYKIALKNIKEYIAGNLIIREDKPLYKPDPKTKVASVPDDWKK